MMSKSGGAKQNDLPSGWRVMTIGDLIFHTKGFAFKTKEFTSHGVPIIKVKDFTLDSLNLSECDFINTDTLNLYDKYKIKNGDVIVATVGSWSSNPNSVVGKVIKAPIEAENSLLNQNAVLLRANRYIRQLYLYYALKNKSFKHYIVGTAQGSANQASVTLKDVFKYKVNLPPLPEQQAIAHILGKLDDKIELNRQINKTLETMAQTLFKSWFVDFDPVIDNAIKAGNKIPEPLQHKADKRKTTKSTLPKDLQSLFPNSFVFNDTLKKWIPDGWKHLSIGKEFNVTMGQSPLGSSCNNEKIGIPFFQGKTDFGFRFPKKRIYCTKPKRMAKKDDVLISVRAPVGSVNMALFDCSIGRGLCAVKHKSDSKSYSYCTVKSLTKIFNSFEGEGTIFGSINQNDLKNISVVTPTLNLIKAFDKKISKNDKQIEVLHNETLTLTKLRDNLLPKLISGKIRV